MPVYTMELWRVLEMTTDIGLNEYPIFDEKYRDHLNKLIKDHYHNREIGMETIAMFRHAVKRRMNEVMPYYNALYKSQQIDFDPLLTMDIKNVATGATTTDAEAKGDSVTNTSSSSKSRAVQSTTPQVMLAGNGDYASSAGDTTSGGTSNGTGSETSESTTNQQSETDSRTFGYQGSPAALVMEYRRALMNVDVLVIDELADCFMGVWDNGDDILPFPYTNLPNL